jgi:hypothetical protein
MWTTIAGADRSHHAVAALLFLAFYGFWLAALLVWR